MKVRPENAAARPRQRGLSLIELMVAGLIGTMLLAGLTQVAIGARDSFTLQENTAELQEHARFALDSVGGILRQFDFTPAPWEEPAAPIGLTAETGNGVTSHGDRIVFRTWSDRNCFGALNPDLDAAGRAAFYLKELSLDLTTSGNLAHSCRYGPDEGGFVTQLPRQGMVPGVEAFQLLYAEDMDGDGGADRWVHGAEWANPDAVLGVQAAMLLASREPAGEREAITYNVLDHVFPAPADGRLRRVVTITQAFRGRVR